MTKKFIIYYIMNDLIIVYITNPSMEKAQSVAHHLLEKRLIACANIVQSNSLYRWEGKIAKETEALLIAKTLATHYENIKQEVIAIHPYTVSCIVKIPIEANESYVEFVQKEVMQK